MRGDISNVCEVLRRIKERSDWNDTDALHHGGFGGIFLGHIEFSEAQALGKEGDREDTAYGADFAVQGEFTDKKLVAEIKRELFGRQKKSQGHGHIVDGSVFGQIGGSEVHCDPAEAVRREETAIFDGGRDAVAGFLDGSVRESHDGEVVHAGIEGIHFDFNEFTFESQGRGGKQFGRHGGGMKNGECGVYRIFP